MRAPPTVQESLQVGQAASVAKRADLREQLLSHRTPLVPAMRQVVPEPAGRRRLRSHRGARPQGLLPRPFPHRAPMETCFADDVGQTPAFSTQALDTIEAGSRSGVS